jgi:hypothetical protein
MSKYPEHERMKAVRGESQAIGEFIDWLRSEETPYTIAEWEEWRACEASSNIFARVDKSWHCENGRKMGGAEHEAEDWGECERCEGTGRVKSDDPRLYPAGIGIEALLARYFDIDLDKINDEKDAMLAEIRKQNEDDNE